MNKDITLYRINNRHHKLKKATNGLEKINIIFGDVKSKKGKAGNLKTDVKEPDSSYVDDGVTYRLYVYPYQKTMNPWVSFLHEELSEGLEIETQNFRLYLFIDIGDSLFLVMGGIGISRKILSFVDHSFGFKFLRRILNPEEDSIRQIKSRGITGARSGISEQYRDELRITNFRKFGKVPKEVDVILGESNSKYYFDFLISKIDRVKIKAGRALNVKTKMDFIELHQFIKKVEDIMHLDPKVYLSSYIEIHDESQKKEYEKALIRKLFNDLEYVEKGNPRNDARFKFDFCDPNNLIEFYEADKYILKHKVGQSHQSFYIETNRSRIYEVVMLKALEQVGREEVFEFEKYIRGVKVDCIKNNETTTSTNFIYAFTTELDKKDDSKGRTVFVVDSKWYYLNADFEKELNEECEKVISSNALETDKVPIIPWDKNKVRTEGRYNLLYKAKAQTFVFDTFLPHQVELCDVMHYTDKEVYLIHVKYGFDAALRELKNQVLLASRKLYRSLKGDNTYLRILYEEASTKGHINKTLESFLNIFRDRKIIFVFAFTSHLKKDISVSKHASKYRSNIAKYSLVDCSRQMNTDNYELRICQIPRN